MPSSAHPRFEDHLDHVNALIEAAVDAADPALAVARHLPGIVDRLTPPIRLIAVGKASVSMARAIVESLDSPPVDGVVTVLPGDRTEPGPARDRLTFMMADHPVPTDRNIEAARAALAIADDAASEGGTLLVLLSGGASAQLTLPDDDLTLDDLRDITGALLRSGAPIQQLNCIRRHCEQLKGGGLARAALGLADGDRGADVVSLILSDVIGDSLPDIGSGPTAADPTTFADALEILDARGLLDANPRIAAHLQSGIRGDQRETVKPGDPVMQLVANHIIGSNEIALHAVEKRAESLGFSVPRCDSGNTGDAASTATRLAETVARLRRTGVTGACVLIGGETTVNVTGNGRGGRNLHMALSLAMELDAARSGSNLESVAAFTFATDGIDGTSDAAGAIVSTNTCARARKLGLDPRELLDNCDSHGFFERIGGLIRTGPTGTNVNDVAGVLLY